MYVFQLFDYYSASRIVLVVAFFECIVVSYVYGKSAVTVSPKLCVKLLTEYLYIYRNISDKRFSVYEPSRFIVIAEWS